MAHPDDSDHGAANFGVAPSPVGVAVGTADLAFGEPKPKQPRGRPKGNGALGPLRPVPGMSGFGKQKPAKSARLKA